MKIYCYSNMEMIHLKKTSAFYKEHSHTSVFVFNLVLNGIVSVIDNGGIRECSKGEIFIVRPFVSHSIEVKNAEMISFCLMKGSYDFEKEFSRFWEKCSCVNSVFTLARKSSFLAVIRCFCACKGMPLRAENIFLHSGEISENFISKYHFIRKFKKHVGMTPHKYQLKSRIKKAKRLMLEGSALTNIALDVGFYDQSHFNKCFKEVVGVTPKEYRRNVIIFK